MVGVPFVMRSFTIVPADDGNGFEVRIDPTLPDGTAIAILPSYEEAEAKARQWARLYGGGISKTRSRRK